jgi:hypothetical protein
MKMFEKLLAAAIVAAALWLSSCKSKHDEPLEEHYGDPEGSVGFDVTSPAHSSVFEAPTRWEAFYRSPGHVARFTIVFDSPQETVSKPIPLSFGKGRFVAVPGSDGSALIAELKKQLEAKSIPAGVTRVQAVPFEYVILGRDQHRDANSKVNWITMKLFLGDGEGEVYLNLNPGQGKGEFSIKDSDYGDFVVKQLARVL